MSVRLNVAVGSHTDACYAISSSTSTLKKGKKTKEEEENTAWAFSTVALQLQ